MLLMFYKVHQGFLFFFTGLKEEMKTLKIDLQNSMHEKEHVKKLLE